MVITSTILQSITCFVILYNKGLKLVFNSVILKNGYLQNVEGKGVRW